MQRHPASSSSSSSSSTSSSTDPPARSSPSLSPPALHVAFLHLDLGIGGAEQLVVNAALALQQRGHHVTLWTTHHDPTHCFAQTRDDGPLAPHVRVAGDWLPRQVLGRFTALCAVVRMLYLALVVGLSAGGWWGWRSRREAVNKHQLQQSQQVDVIFCDGVSAMVPLLRWLWGFPVLFYCHFPDKLLCTDRASLVKRWYRAPLDWVEEATTGAATLIAVNSRFTAQVFAEAFPRAYARHASPAVIYPAINLDSFVPPKAIAPAAAAAATRTAMGTATTTTARKTKGGREEESSTSTMGLRPFVSLNRFERKKNIGLALEAFSLVQTHLQQQDKDDQDPDPNTKLDGLRLVIAGGYDEAVPENKAYMQELHAHAHRLGLSKHVSFQPSISDATRATLLQEALGVLYTPDREHFGIVPLEAMYAGSPVVAVASGGPLETVRDGETGFLCEGTGRGFAEAMLRLVGEPGLKEEMGRAGHGHVKDKFGLDAFAATLERAVLETRTRASGKGEKRRGLVPEYVEIMLPLLVMGTIVTVVLAMWYQ